VPRETLVKEAGDRHVKFVELDWDSMRFNAVTADAAAIFDALRLIKIEHYDIPDLVDAIKRACKQGIEDVMEYLKDEEMPESTKEQFRKAIDLYNQIAELADQIDELYRQIRRMVYEVDP